MTVGEFIAEILSGDYPLDAPLERLADSSPELGDRTTAEVDTITLQNGGVLVS